MWNTLFLLFVCLESEGKERKKLHGSARGVVELGSKCPLFTVRSQIGIYLGLCHFPFAQVKWRRRKKHLYREGGNPFWIHPLSKSTYVRTQEGGNKVYWFSFHHESWNPSVMPLCHYAIFHAQNHTIFIAQDSRSGSILKLDKRCWFSY